MIFVDTSAWVEYLRATGSDLNVRVRDLVRSGDIAVSDPVIMEVFAGARSDVDVRRLRALMGRCTALSCRTSDFLMAAEIRRSARRAGTTVRNSLDCLIAAVAIREGLPLLQADRDFDTIARLSELELA